MTAKSPQSVKPTVLHVAIPVPLFRLFDYLAPSFTEYPLKPGIRLEVPFGNGKKIAYLIKIDHESTLAESKLKPILSVLDKEPLLSLNDLTLIDWASRYYHHPLGDVIGSVFPALLRQGKSTVIETHEVVYALTPHGKTLSPEDLKRSPKQQALLTLCQHHPLNVVSQTDLVNFSKHWRPAVKALIAKGLLHTVSLQVNKPYQPDKLAHKTESIKSEGTKNYTLKLNLEQQSCVDAINSALSGFNVFLLDGVTGSGKTEVYLRIITTILARNQQVLVLVPEINLTPQLEARFQSRFADAIAVSHSQLTDKQRLQAWLSIQQGNQSILLGTRSALLTPMPNLGLIILDEEHDPSYKQQEGFRFSARDVAVMRAKLLNIPVILGSATPSLESLANCEAGRYRHLMLTERAGEAAQPDMLLLDIRNKKMHGGLSEALLTEIRKTLMQNEQVLLFLNRRGFAPTLICHHCGWVARCRSCDANLVVHQQDRRMRCHHCGKEDYLIQICPACQHPELTPLGLGTERIEDVLKDIFPEQTLVRLDRDTTQRKGKLQSYLDQINDGSANIILGTQMLAKGHHFPNVTLVALIDADSGLFGLDYRATERLAQLVMQVAGRAGRAEKKGRVILQTRQPEHPLLNTLITQGYRQFAITALAERRQAKLPPYSYQAIWRAQANKPGLPFAFLQSVVELIHRQKNPQIAVFGPVPAPMEKRAGVYRCQLLLQSKSRSNLQTLLAFLVEKVQTSPDAKKVRWSLDVDPVDLY
jgi:primosomal protein N' (replication factor Y)